MNIILQHWHGELGALEVLSSDNISHYAKQIGANYKLLRGKVFRDELTPQCQKIFMLDESFDDYETVLMLDMDMFARKGLTENVFEHEGVGLHELMQDGLARKMHHMYPVVGNIRYSYWGGAIYKMDLELRKLLRAQFNQEHLGMELFNDNFYDEGIMHGLAVRAKIKGRYFPDNKWCKSSYEPDVDEAYMIHVRPRTMIDGKKVPRTKMINYKDLVRRGLIE